MASWHVRAARVPDGASVEWWVEDGRLASARIPDAREAPGAWVVEGGLLDAHAHLTFEPHDVFGLERSSDELIAAGLRAHREAGELVVRDAGSLPGVGPERLPGVIGCGPFLAPPGQERQRETLALAAELGVTVLAGTDEEPHGSVAFEVATLVGYGLPPAAAVAGATTAGQAFLGVPPPRAGEPARLVMFNADPVADVSVLARPVAVLAGAR